MVTKINKINYGNIVMFGSGETADTGKAVQRKFLQSLHRKINIVILETPAGFQPNSNYVAQKIADVFNTSLREFAETVTIIPARKKDTLNSPDNMDILKPLEEADYIFLGPGSPTYALHQLRNSLAWALIRDRWKQGATICLSSAAVLASGKFTLPVYEIYKAGHDLYWERGLDLLNPISYSTSFITHFNNKEGGKSLDTRFCFMGEERFEKLLKLLPEPYSIIGLDEHTAIIIDIKKGLFTVDGVGKVAYINNQDRFFYTAKRTYPLSFLVNQTK